MSVNFFTNWFFSKLPGYFKAQDSYQNANGQGLLERYLQNFGAELDANFIPYIDNFMDLFDAMLCEAALLPQLSFILGIPISIDGTEATYRKVLQYAVQLYKVKGTAPSYAMLFNLLGLEITILEDTPGRALTYDMDPVAIYDNPTGILQYDTGCATCSGYTIAYNSSNDPMNVAATTPAILAIAQTIICYLQPINATFNGFMKRLNITEVLPITITESSTVNSFLVVPREFSTTDFNSDFD